MPRSGTCKHFTGVQNECCELGIRYDSLTGPGMPCIVKFRREWTATCDKFEEPTQAELDEWEAFVQKRTRDTVMARAAIVQHTEGKRGVSGRIKCPVCDAGTLSFSVSGYNGHIHAGCSTEGCVSWME